MAESSINKQIPDIQQFKSNVLVDVIFFLITFGVYSIAWQKRKIRFINLMSPEADFSFNKWTNLTIQTCIIYHLYYEIAIGKEIEKINKDFGLTETVGKTTGLDWALCMLSLGLLPDISHQLAINRLADKFHYDAGL